MTQVGHFLSNIARGAQQFGGPRSRSRDVSSSHLDIVGKLEVENSQLRLYLATLVKLLIDKQVITPEEFEQIANELDAADGVSDGRFDGEITPEGQVIAGDSADETLAFRQLAQAVNEIEK